MLPIEYAPLSGKMEIPILEPCIDSLCLSIDYNKVNFIEKRMESEIVTYYVDLDEFDDEIKPARPYIYEKNGIRIRFSKVMRMDKDGTQIARLNITLSSKLLKERYFQGFCSWNIELAYEFLISMKIVKLSYNDFLNAHVSDIDICYNFYTKSNLFIDLVKYYESRLKFGCSRFFSPHIKRTRKGEIINLGLSLNSRDKASPARPYAKFYFKELELTTKSIDFYQRYLEPHNPNIINLFRLEYTIKAFSHKERLLKKNYLKKPFYSLKQLLEVSRDELREICLSFHTDYFQSKEDRSYIREFKGLSPSNILVCDLMAQLIEKGASEQEIYRCINGLEKTKKSKLKTHIKKMLDHVKNGSLSLEKTLQKNTELHELILIFQN